MGLPGNSSPLGDFDPLGITRDLSVEELKMIREAETMHARVSMLALLSLLLISVSESISGMNISNHNTDIFSAREVLNPVCFGVGIFDFLRAFYGWENRNSPIFKSKQHNFKGNYDFITYLKDDYYPGDVGLDIFGLKPKDSVDFNLIQTKELEYGRLSMIIITFILITACFV